MQPRPKSTFAHFKLRMFPRRIAVPKVCASKQVNETVSQSEGEEIPIAYVEIDGSAIPVVTSEIDSSQPGKQGDRQRTKEAKIGGVFTQTATDERGRPIRDES